MNKTGIVEYPFENKTTVYEYKWSFPNTLNDFQELAALTQQGIIETDTFSFDSEILQNTKNSMKAIFFVGTGDLFVKAFVGKPSVHGEFTNSKIELKSVTVKCLDPTFRNSTISIQSSKVPRKVQPASLHSYFHITGASLTLSKTTRQELSLLAQTDLCDKNSKTKNAIWYNTTIPDYGSYSGFNITFTFDHAYWRTNIVGTKTVDDAILPRLDIPVADTLNLISLFETKRFADFVISCGDSKFHTHKVVLADRSPVFASMFEQPLSEAVENKMEIKDAQSNTVEEFIKFLYTGTADYSMSAQLLILADKYCVDNLKKICETYMINCVNLDNALQLYNFGQFVNSEALIEKCLVTLMSGKKFKFQTEEQLKEFIQNHPALACKVLLA